MFVAHIYIYVIRGARADDVFAQCGFADVYMLPAKSEGIRVLRADWLNLEVKY